MGASRLHARTTRSSPRDCGGATTVWVFSKWLSKSRVAVRRERAASGVFLDGGGLYGTEDAVNFVVRGGEISRVDGPYAEAKEVVGGWSIMQFDSLEEAVADQREFAELHAKHWPEVTVISTLRQISTGPEAPGD